MTEEELIRHAAADAPVPVVVTANDYSYHGWIVGLAKKRSGVFRGVVEDVNGRLFIHNSSQLSYGLKAR